MCLRFLKGYFSCRIYRNLKVPCIQPFNIFFCNIFIIHISWRNSSWQMKFIKNILLNGKFYQVGYNYFYLFFWTNVSNLHVHNIVALCIFLCNNCSFTLLNCFFIFFFCLFFFLNNSLDSLVIKLCNKFIDT